MLRKIRAMLKQEEGFTLMELMIVAVIIGILAGIAIPIYNGVQDRAKTAVGIANAAMLNRAAEQLVSLDKFMGDTDSVFHYKDEGEDVWQFNGENEKHISALLTYVGLESVEYVKWDTDKYEYVADITEELE